MAVKRKMMDVSSDGKLTDLSKLEQGTDAWHKWREAGIGASEAASVMEESPWTSRFQLWAQKTGLLSAPEPHINSAVAMRRGTELEPVARDLYIKQTGIEVTPETMVHPQYEFIRCSLDGWNADKKHIIEIKCPGSADLKTARKNKIPEKYKWQLAHQCLIADPLTVDYVTFDGKEELIIIPHQRDAEKETTLLKELIAFWDLVVTKQPPGVSVKELRGVTKQLTKSLEKVSESVKAIELMSSLLADEDIIEF